MLTRPFSSVQAGILFDTCLVFTLLTGRTFEGVKVRLGVRQGKVFNDVERFSGASLLMLNDTDHTTTDFGPLLNTV